MKLKTFLLIILIVLVLYISVPAFLIYYNDILGLPSFNSFPLKIIGMIFILIDIGIFTYNSFLFKREGKGTPIPTESTKRFVKKGLYKYTRNPIYIAHVLGLLGIYFLFGRLLLLGYAIMGAVAFHLFVVYWEEPDLKKRFGKEYTKFTKEVPRWF